MTRMGSKGQGAVNDGIVIPAHTAHRCEVFVGSFYLQGSLIITDHLSNLPIILSLSYFHYLISFPNYKLMKTSHGSTNANL